FTYHWRKHQEARAVRHRKDAVHNFLGRLLLDRTTADRAMGCSNPGKEQTQIIENLSDSADCGSWVIGCRFLVNRNCWGKPFDGINIWFVHLTKELAGIRRKRFDVAPLTLGKDGIKSQRTLA